MFDLFGSVKGYTKLSAIRIDNNVFRLHYKLTVIVLAAFSILITSRQYIGDPIDCMVDEIPPDVMDTYCWIYSTFTLPKRLSGRIGKDVIHPGVAFHTEDKDEVKFHRYYQWVCYVLCFQAMLFYIPHYIWKMWEGERIKKLVQHVKSPFIEESVKASRIDTIVKYFISNLNMHNYYLYRFVFCEVLNLVNVIGQIYFMDYFLDGEFSSYGWDVLWFTDQNPEDRNDPMNRVFPKITKCTFHKYGPSGTVQQFDGLCVLPLNIINEKIYVILWFWFVILSIVTSLSLVYRVIVLLLPNLRKNRLASCSSIANKEEINYIASKCASGDWFVLYQIGINVDPLIFRDIISNLNKALTQL